MHSMKFNVQMLFNFWEVIGFSRSEWYSIFFLEHMRRMQSDELNESTSSLALIMPSIIDQVLLDQDEDKNDMQSNEIIPFKVSFILKSA